MDATARYPGRHLGHVREVDHVHLPQIDPNAVALGNALTAALEQAANGGEITPIIHAADKIIAAGLYFGPRGELVSMMLFRQELASGARPPSTYYDLSVRLVEEAVCTAGEMKAAVCGTLLMRGQEQGWLEPHLYDMLASGAQGHPDWQSAMSLIKRQDPASFHTPRPAEN
jgi:hypothetical protein